MILVCFLLLLFGFLLILFNPIRVQFLVCNCVYHVGSCYE